MQNLISAGTYICLGVREFIRECDETASFDHVTSGIVSCIFSEELCTSDI